MVTQERDMGAGVMHYMLTSPTHSLVNQRRSIILIRTLAHTDVLTLTKLQNIEKKGLGRHPQTNLFSLCERFVARSSHVSATPRQAAVSNLDECFQELP